MIAPPSAVGIEEIVANLVLWLRLAIEAIGALVIGVGMILASVRFLRGTFPPAPRDFIEAHLTLARFLAIALEFQLGADILSTAVAPSWEAIGKLAAIAVIRTALNYFSAARCEKNIVGDRRVGQRPCSRRPKTHAAPCFDVTAASLPDDCTLAWSAPR